VDQLWVVWAVVDTSGRCSTYQLSSVFEPARTRNTSWDADMRGEVAVRSTATATALIEGGVGGLPATCFPNGNMTHG
jgi:hypothetical protein